MQPSVVRLRDGRLVTLREAAPDDAAGVLDLIDSVARERRWLLNTEAYWSVAAQRQTLLNVRQSGGVTIVAATEDGRLVGWLDLSRPVTELVRHTATLGVGVLAPYRGAGLGHALMHAAFEAGRARGIEKLELTVRSTNTRAIALYERLGWQHEGRSLRAFKQDGAYEDRLYMGLWIAEDRGLEGT